MTDQTIKLQRRKFLRILTIGSALVPMSGLLLHTPALAQQEKLSEDDPLAKSLNYSHDATKVTVKQREEDQFCYNCQLLQGEGGAWRPCQAFANKLVNENGWCSAYVLKT
ncbi:MAG: high-potential iron-sulfur protein [Gammaproteobacteria bacterium]|jgi:hypothetical protein|nr:high-potential iron-sulfur protein [Gammaproteobacteria bacterium]